jgi:hypothetical protein
MLFSFGPTFAHELLGKVSVHRVIISVHERERLGNDVVFIWSHIPLREKLWTGITFFCVHHHIFVSIQTLLQSPIYWLYF